MNYRLLLLGILFLPAGGLCFGQGSPTKETAVIQGTKSAGSQDQPLNGPVQVTVDWSSEQGINTPQMFALNGFHAGNPALVANPAYQSGLAFMGIGSLRYHNATDLSDSVANEDGWLDLKNKTWAGEK
ncbi:MAG: hypothetical protein WCH43_02960, partial [Verrucomicrobiota bacterium]